MSDLLLACALFQVFEFAYVWLSIVLMHCLLTPALALIMHFKGQRVIDQAKRKSRRGLSSIKERVVSAVRMSESKLAAAWNTWRERAASLRERNRSVRRGLDETYPAESELEVEDVHGQLLKSAKQMQQRIARTLSTILTITSFGVLVPIMLMLAPLTMLLNLRARQWIAAHSEERSFGVLTAERILVHPPIFLIRNLGYGLNILIMAFVFLDLEVGFTNALMPATS